MQQLKEFLTFYKSNTADIHAQIGVVGTRSGGNSLERCIAGTYAGYLGGGLTGCVGAGLFGAVFGKVGAAVGCAVGGIIGAATGAIKAALEHCEAVM